MADYRFRIIGSDAAANGDVHLDTYIERSEDSGATWQQVPQGHITVVLDGEAVMAISDGPGTITQKRAALLALFKQEVEDRGIASADAAELALLALLPNGDWPVTVTL